MRKIMYGLLFVCLLGISSITYSAYSYYGPTLESEHLYRIAKRFRPQPNLTIQQVMVAILNTNPEAFNKNNINGLRSGYRLYIPQTGFISKINPHLAYDAVIKQNQLWKMYDHEVSSKTSGNNKKKHMYMVKSDSFLNEIPLVGSNREAIKITTKENATNLGIGLKQKNKLTMVKSNSFLNEIPLVGSNREAIQRDTQEKTSILDIVKQQGDNQKTSEASLKSTQSESLQAAGEIEERINGFISETKQFELETSNRLTILTKQNQALQEKVNQLSDDLRMVTYNFIQLASKAQRPTKEYALLFSNFKANALHLLGGISALILLTYLLTRTFRNNQEGRSGQQDEYDYLNSDESIPSKLDLARAYFDMGDYASAKKVLKDVLTKGNKEQQEGASDLLLKMNKSQ